MQVHFHGHACFTLSGKQGRLIIDPFLTGNPVADINAATVAVDGILVSHGHRDHLGDAVEISRANQATIIAPFELAYYCEQKGAPTHGMHIGGSHKFPFADVKLTQALHGSAVTEDNRIIYTGNPCGFLITLDGVLIYHAGDTGLFGDMELLGDLNQIDLALLPIGDNYVMGIQDAVIATKMLKAKSVIPMHYNTFDLIKQDAKEFAKGVEGFCKPIILEPGNTIEIMGK
ncbi:MAG TPA: metal-dependent hydrolase [Candidatus Deferrimicrobium sp.]|nr:metal-dependent hydrolase [Candidatus Deferrimicrobium sp.]